MTKKKKETILENGLTKDQLENTIKNSVKTIDDVEKIKENPKTYEARKVKAMKDFAKLGIHVSIALQAIGEDRVWFERQIVSVSSGGATLLKDYYNVYYAEAVVSNLASLKSIGQQSSLKELLSFSFEKTLELKEKENRSKKRETKKSKAFDMDF